jgi:hypothetical protein
MRAYLYGDDPIYDDYIGELAGAVGSFGFWVEADGLHWEATAVFAGDYLMEDKEDPFGDSELYTTAKFELNGNILQTNNSRTIIGPPTQHC